MIELTYAQKESIGLQYVLEALQPCSPYGRELLRELVPMGPDKKQDLLRQFFNIQRVMDHENTCRKELELLQRGLMAMKQVRAVAKKCLETALNEIELFQLKHFLLKSFEIYPYFCHIQSVFQLKGIEFLDTTEALNILDPDKNRVATFFIGDNWSASLLSIRQEKRHWEQLLRQNPDAEKREYLLSHRSAAAAREEQEETQIRAALSRALQTHIPKILHNMDAIADLDLTVEKAHLAQRWGGVMPTLTENRLEMDAMTNPRIHALLQQRDNSFTPISIHLQQGATVITGANMGGKSVALKTIALNILLVHYGLFPFAASASVPLFQGLHIISEDLESVDQGLSSFGGEMVRFNTMAQQLEQGFHFVLLDEFARGTNPQEGAAIVRAVTRYLNEKQAISVLATHYDHVAEVANAHYQVAGLKDLDWDRLQEQLRGIPAEDTPKYIAAYMNYGLYPVDGRQNCPRDALNICRLLGMDNRIVCEVEKAIAVDRKKY